MIIHYCDKCGVRVSQSDLDVGKARLVDETHAICSGCSTPAKRRSSRSVGTREPDLKLTASAKKDSHRNLVPATRGPVSAPRPVRTPPVAERSSSWSLAIVGIGVGVVVLIAVLALVLGGDEKTSPRKEARKPAGAGKTKTNVPAGKKNAKVPPQGGGSTTSTGKTEYDPRAAVAASMLAAAKTYREKNPDDPWGYKEQLEDLCQRYARTPPADEAARLLAEWAEPPAGNLAKTLTAYWPFDEGSGDTTKDGSGKGHDGRLVNNPQWVPGRIGKALRFEGQQYVEIARPEDLEFGSDCTFTCWVKTSKGGTLLAKTAPNWKWAPNGKCFFIQNSMPKLDSGWVATVTGSTALGDDQWHHVAIVFKASGKKVSFFVDGRRAGSNQLNMVADPKGFVIRLGLNPNGFASPFVGALDEVCVFRRRLLLGQIRTLMEGGLSGTSQSQPTEPAQKTLTFGQSKWIWHLLPRSKLGLPAGTIYLRRAFSVPDEGTLKTGEVMLTADNFFSLYVNGKPAGDSLDGSDAYAWTKPRRFDIGDLLVTGRNIIAIEAFNGAESPAGLLATLAVEMADGTRITLNTDTAWKTSGREVPGWHTTDFNDSSWSAAHVEGAYGVAPWGGLTPTGLPPKRMRRSLEEAQSETRALVEHLKSTQSTPEPTGREQSGPAKLASNQSAYARFAVEFQGLTAKKGWALAEQCLAKARKEPALADLKEDLAHDAELLTLAKNAQEAIAKGAQLLADGRPFNLIQLPDKVTAVGGSSKAKVTKVQGDSIEIEQQVGGGRLALNISLGSLTPGTHLELARLGLPDDGERELALALMRWDQRTSPNGRHEVDEFIAKAEKCNAPAAKIAHARKWLKLIDREEAAGKALTDLEALVATRRLREASAALDAFLKEYGATIVAHDARNRLAELPAVIQSRAFNPGLWASYWVTKARKVFGEKKDAKAKTDLNFVLGHSSAPDPSLPSDNFQVRYGGILRIAEGGQYEFVLRADDNLTVWIDGQEKGHVQHPKTTTFKIDLAPGDHTIRMDHTEGHGDATLTLQWKPPGANKPVDIPAEALWHDPALIEKYEKP